MRTTSSKETESKRAKAGSKMKDIIEVKDVLLVVKNVKDLKEGSRFEGDVGHVGLKNKNSYLVGTHTAEYKVVENDITVHSGKIRGETYLQDVIYSPCLNCYFLASSKLYRKDINGKPPYPFMDVKWGNRAGSCFRYSNIHHRLTVNDKKSRFLLMVNPRTRKVELRQKVRPYSELWDFKLLGDQHGRVVCLFGTGRVTIFSLGCFEKRRGVIAEYKVDLIRERIEYPLSIAVCRENKYILVETAQNDLCI